MHDDDDQFWKNELLFNTSISELYFDTNQTTYMRIKSVRERCLERYPKLDCFQYFFLSVNTRPKSKKLLKLSLYFDRVNIKHMNKMELISLLNYLIGIMSLWLGASYKNVEKYALRILSKFLRSQQARTLLGVILLIGLVAHANYILQSIRRNNLMAVTFFQPSKFILQPVFALCFELEKIQTRRPHENRESTGYDLAAHTKNLSQLVRSIRFLDKEFKPRVLNVRQLNFEAREHHYRFENIEIEYFWYFKYKCYQIKHQFEPKEVKTDFSLDTVFLQFDLIDLEFELMFYANLTWSLENKIYIPAHSFTVLRYIAVYTVPVGENLTFCLHNQDDRSDTLIRNVRDVLNSSYEISTKLLPLTHSYFQYPIRDEIFYNALNQVEEEIIRNKTAFEPKKNCSIKVR